MYSKYIKKRGLKNNFLKKFKDSENCEVSRASTEIMLDRFSNGKKIEFPF